LVFLAAGKTWADVPPPRAAASSVPAPPPTATPQGAAAAPLLPSLPSCGSLDKQLANLQENLNSIAADNAELRNQVDAKARRLVDMERALGESARKVADEEAKLRDAQARLTEKDAAAKQLTDELFATKKAKGDAERNNLSLAADRTKLDAQVAQLDKDARRLKAVGDIAYQAWHQESDRAQRALIELDATLAQNRDIIKRASDRETVLQAQVGTAEEARVGAETDRDGARNTLEKTQAELRKLRQGAEALIVRFFTASALLLFIGMLVGVYQVHGHAKARAHGAIPENSIAADVRDDLIVHLAAAKHLRWLILGAALLAAMAALLGPALFLYVEVRSPGSNPADLTAVLDSVYWRMLIGFAGPLAALLAIYKTVHEKGKDALTLCSALGVPTGAVGQGANREDGSRAAEEDDEAAPAESPGGAAG
jgi:hypothetical protein